MEYVTAFKGGIHPYEGKKNCLKQMIQSLLPRRRFIYVSAHRCSCKTAGCKRRPGLAKNESPEQADLFLQM